LWYSPKPTLCVVEKTRTQSNQLKQILQIHTFILPSALVFEDEFEAVESPNMVWDHMMGAYIILTIEGYAHSIGVAKR
jgi:Leu/Phe-tRNA-protein transferase